MLKQTFRGRLLSSIKTDANIAKAPLIKSPMVFCFPQSRSAKDYMRLAMELINAPSHDEDEPDEDVATFDEGVTSEGSSPFEFKQMPEENASSPEDSPDDSSTVSRAREKVRPLPDLTNPT